MNRRENRPSRTIRPPHTARVRTLLLSLLMAVLGFCICFPLVLLLAGSLLDQSELSRSLGGVLAGGSGFAAAPPISAGLTAESYIGVLIDTPAYHVLFWNSAAIAICVLAGQVVIATPAAWVLARYRFPGRRALFFLYVLLMMMPFQVMMLPNYLVLNELGVNNTLLAIILPGIFSAFPVFIMRHFFAAVPDSIIESARLDGAGEIAVFLRIGVPLGAPGIFAALVLGFFEYWNLVEQPLAFLKDQTLWPLSLFQPSMSLENAGPVFAAAVIAALPSVLIFFMGKEYLEQGIAATTRKDA